MKGLPKNGDRVRYLDAFGEGEGICNGEPKLICDATYIPVYVREGDRCLIVPVAHLLESDEVVA